MTKSIFVHSQEVFLKYRTHFDAAHRLENYNGKCSNLHGHRWNVEFVFVGDMKDSVNGILIDFSEIKDMVESILPDHAYLNEVFQVMDPTAEYLAVALYKQIYRKLIDFLVTKGIDGVGIYSVEVYETDKASVMVKNVYPL